MYLFKISKTFCMIHYKRSDFIRNVLWKIVNISKFFVGDVSVWGKFLTIIQGLFIWIKGWNEQGVVTMIWHSCSYIIIKLKLHFFFPTWLAEPTQDRVLEDLGQYFPCNYLTLQWKIPNLYFWTLHGSWKGPIK